MKLVTGLLGILATIGGTLSGVMNWYLSEFVLDWGEPTEYLFTATWILHVLGLGVGITLIGIAAILETPRLPYDSRNQFH